MKARDKYISKVAKLYPDDDLTSNSPLRRGVEMAASFSFSMSPETFSEWAKWKIDLGDGKLHPASTVLLLIAAKFPATMLGYFNTNGTFIPGVLPLLTAKKDLYTDVLDEILSEDLLSGKSVDEIVALSAKRGYRSNSDTVRQRIRIWDSPAREKSRKRSHT